MASPVELVAPAGDVSSSRAASDTPDGESEVRAVETDPTRRYTRVGTVHSAVVALLLRSLLTVSLGAAV